MVDYLSIAKLKIDEDEEFPLLQQPPKKVETEELVDKEYLMNLKDTFKIHINAEVMKLCNDAVEESLYFDDPVLINHHTKKRDFVSEMTTLLDSLVDFDVVDYEEDDESDDEVEV